MSLENINVEKLKEDLNESQYLLSYDFILFKCKWMLELLNISYRMLADELGISYVHLFNLLNGKVKNASYEHVAEIYNKLLQHYNEIA